MALTRISSRQSRQKNRYRLWVERLMAIVVLVNYSLVLFNLSYIPLRDFWSQGKLELFFKFGKYEVVWPQVPVRILPPQFSEFITNYDVFKGIEPNRVTEQYLEQVQTFKKAVSLEGLSNPNENIDNLLLQLQKESLALIEENPFQVAHKTGTLERIKNKMRKYVFPNQKNASSKEAFKTFWSREFLKKDYDKKLDFFEQQIAPLIATNYYRFVGENGNPIDNFGLIDFPFFLIFFPEFLIRTLLISRRYTGVSWMDAMLWRWYDIFLIIPIFRFLRIIPLVIRLNQADIINLISIKKQATQGFVAGIAENITEVIVVRIINQLQDSIKQGDIQKFLAQRQNDPYINFNEVNEIEEIIRLFLEVISEKTLPQIKPEAEAFLKYNFDQALSNAPAYKTLQILPGVKVVQSQLSQQLASRIYQSFCEALTNLLKEDKKFQELLDNLIQKFRQTMTTELKAQKSTDKLEYLITELLEEIKINYVERLSQEDVEGILEQTRQLREKARASVLLNR